MVVHGSNEHYKKNQSNLLSNGFCMILWDVVFCLHSVAYWFINVDGVLNCLDLIIQTVFISCKIRRQQLNRIASSNDVTLPKDKNGIILL